MDDGEEKRGESSRFNRFWRIKFGEHELQARRRNYHRATEIKIICGNLRRPNESRTDEKEQSEKNAQTRRQLKRRKNAS